MSATSPPGSTTERLRQAVADAGDESARLHALLAVARHFAEVSDGVNGLQAAREAPPPMRSTPRACPSTTAATT